MNLQYILLHELTFPQLSVQNECMVHRHESEMAALFSDRLKLALDAAGIKRRGAGVSLARLTSVTPKAASKWVNGESQPRKEKLELIADRCGVRAEWLEYGIGPMKVDGNVELVTDYRERRLAPVISWVQAGSWSEACDPLALGDGESWEEVPSGTGSCAFWLRVIGDSMTALAGVSVPEGSLILVDPDVPADSGRLVVAKLIDSNEVTFKRLVIDGGQWYLKPLNPAYPVITINSNCRIVGVVTEAKQKL